MNLLECRNMIPMVKENGNMNELNKQIQKQTGVKMGQYDSEHNRLYHMCQAALLSMNKLFEQLEEAGLQNEQFALDFYDALNTLSVKY